MSFNNREKETMSFNHKNKPNTKFPKPNKNIYDPFECYQHLKGFFNLLTIVYFNIF